MAKKTAGQPKKLFSPLLLSLAAATAWAATNAPVSLSNLGLVASWLIAALAVGLAACAILALALPVLKLVGEATLHWLQTSTSTDKNGPSA